MMLVSLNSANFGHVRQPVRSVVFARSRPRTSRPITSRSAVAGNSDKQIRLLLVDKAVPEKVYYALEAVVLLVQLGLVDAAYSGDWSRIGVISKDTELLLQKFVIFIAVAHSLVAAACAYVAAQRGRNVPLSAALGFSIGAMELYRQIQQDSDGAPPANASTQPATEKGASSKDGAV